MGLIIVLFIIIILAKSYSNGNFNRRRHQSKPFYPIDFQSNKEESSDATLFDYSNSYKDKYLFSRNEKSELRKLLDWAQANNLYVFAKVRLLDIIEPRSKEDKSLLWKIQAKHIDFVVCDSDFRIKYLIELDDNSHNRLDRIERDEFVKQALNGAGYSLLQTKGISEEFLNRLSKAS